MKKVILGAALCGAAIAFASPASADDNENFWAAAANTISDWLLGVNGGAVSDNALVDITPGDFLDGSTNALVLGATGMPTPTAMYLDAATNLYLLPNGYEGDTASIIGLTTPQTFSFLPSVQDGQKILVDSIMESYNNGDMGCNAAGVCSDPLTIFTYSQSSAIAALAQYQLADKDIPTDALRFIMLGANPSGVADNLYPTEIFNIDGDLWAEPTSIGSTWQDILLGLGLHLAYLGLTDEQIDSASTIVDGLTTLHEIPTLDFSELFQAFINIWFGQ